MKDGKCFGVLDVDSPSLARFSLEDQAGLERIVIEIMAYAMWKERIAD
jgi:putative methionine-R-sulfoxide reductase with GAF domain